MTRKRWLPVGVTEYRDRHGKARYRFRMTKQPTHHFRAPPGTEEFAAEYAAAKAAARPGAVIRKAAPGSFDDLCSRLYQSPRWLRTAAKSRSTNKAILERFGNLKTRKGERFGSLPVKLMTVATIERELGKMADRPGAANSLRKQIKRVLNYAVKLGWRADNPAALTDAYPSGPGWRTWTDEDIEQYRAVHAYGTRARLTMELALNTAGRRCNLATLDRTMLRKGKFHIQHAKGCDATIVAASPEVLAAIEAMGVTGIGAFIVTEYGRPFTIAGLGNKFREWCDAAGLPTCTLHGLRKAQSRRLAEAGATMLQGRAVTGHKRDDTFAYYAEKANRERLADDALANLENRKLANLANLALTD